VSRQKKGTTESRDGISGRTSIPPSHGRFLDCGRLRFVRIGKLVLCLDAKESTKEKIKAADTFRQNHGSLHCENELAAFACGSVGSDSIFAAVPLALFCTECI
jgi:hypothetical protein